MEGSALFRHVHYGTEGPCSPCSKTPLPRSIQAIQGFLWSYSMFQKAWHGAKWISGRFDAREAQPSDPTRLKTGHYNGAFSRHSMGLPYMPALTPKTTPIGWHLWQCQIGRVWVLVWNRRWMIVKSTYEQMVEERGV